MPTERERLALEFFADWGESFERMCESFGQYLAPDSVWDQRPIPRLRGPKAAVRFLSFARVTMGLATIEVEILSVVSEGDFVHTERIDRLRRADGSLIAAAPVAGVMEFDGAQLVRWREYFDAGGLAGQALATTSLHLARRAIGLLAPGRAG